MKKLIALLLLFPQSGVFAQNLTLDSCINSAFRNFEFQADRADFITQSELSIKNANKAWLPTLELDASFTWQNENITIPVGINVPGIESPSVPLNFNRILVNFTQNIYDGSTSSRTKDLAAQTLKINQVSVEQQQINLESKVSALFMGVLLAREQKKILNSKSDLLEERLDVMEGALEYGGSMPATILSLETEILKVEQQKTEITYQVKALTAQLSEITGLSITEDDSFENPNAVLVSSASPSSRPEIRLLDLQSEQLEVQKSLKMTSRNPRVFAFGNVGAGNPGYDIFAEQEISPMVFVGLGVKWNIIDWNYNRNEMTMIQLQQNQLDRVKSRMVSTFNEQTNAEKREIEMLNEQLKRDEKILQLQNSLTQIKSAQLENGVITSTEYLEAVDQLTEFKTQQKVHELSLVMAIINYNLINENPVQ
jgi:outer membrane protein TolC